MSLNVVAAWPLSIVCASDRRLTDLASGRIVTNRSTKLLLFGCADAHGVFTYNGIGLDDSGLTPCDWLFELHDSKRSFDESLPDLLEDIRSDLTARLAILRAKYGPKKARHTFVCGAWHQGRSMIYGISNYERIDDNAEDAEGQAEASITTLTPGAGQDVRIVTTGAYSRLAEREGVARAIKEHSTNRVKAAAVKIIRSAAYRSRGGRGSVGSAAQWAALGADRNEVWAGFDVVNGALAQEPPNLINISMEIPMGGDMTCRIGGQGVQIKDAYTGGGRAREVGAYDQDKKRFAFEEPKCGICGSPWPKAQLACEVCLIETSQNRSGRARR